MERGLAVRWLAAVVGVLCVAAAVGGLAAAGSFAGDRPPAPNCLVGNSQRSARVGPLVVSPAPETVTANPRTQISLLGVPANRLEVISVRGSKSGRHSGRLVPYSQGDGGSFLPNRPFAPNEVVTVEVAVSTGGQRQLLHYSFRTAVPFPTGHYPPFPNPPAPTADLQSFNTLPGVEAPILTVTTPDKDPAAGDIFLTNGPGPGRYGALIYSPTGRLIWFDQLPPGEVAENLAVQRYRGEPVLTFWVGKVPDLGFGEGEDLVLNRHYQTILRVQAGNGLKADLHDFQLGPDNTAFITAYNPIRCNLSAVGGDSSGVIIDTAIQEIDLATGLVRWEWHALDHIPVGDSHTSPPAGEQPWDWFHLNSIDVESNGNLFISARNTWAGYQLEGGGGRVLWELGGVESSFKLGPGAETAWQHDGTLLSEDEVGFFDDGANPPVHSQSRAIRVRLNFQTHEATLVASYTHPSPLLSVSQGNAEWLPGGKVVVGYGSIPEISEYSPTGELLFDAHLPLDMSSYRAYRFPWEGLPATPPVVAANENSTEEETVVHVSWNGATGVQRWRILAGETPQALSAVAEVPATSFEVSASLPHRYRYVAAEALGKEGKELGSSPPTQVTPYKAVFGS